MAWENNIFSIKGRKKRKINKQNIDGVLPSNS